MVKLILGIDPGNNGGIIALRQNLVTEEWGVERSFRLERGEDCIVDFFSALAYPGPYVAYLEKVHGWGEGRSFNFGMYYGFVRGVLKMRGVPIVDVTPQKWMGEMGVPPQRGEKALHRQAMREMAGAIQGEVTATNWNAAALLIAFYGLRCETPQGLRE